MKLRMAIIIVVLGIGCVGLLRLHSVSETARAGNDSQVATSIAAAAVATRVDFPTQVRPILEKCQPCHFNGGKMYEKLPFDRPETVKKLGEKLFTRIQAENDRRVIREFLAQE